MNQELMIDLMTKVEEMWFSYKFEEIWTLITLPLSILELIALYKINQVLKIYIEDNKDFL